jgi:hypothetical protein
MPECCLLRREHSMKLSNSLNSRRLDTEDSPATVCSVNQNLLGMH